MKNLLTRPLMIALFLCMLLAQNAIAQTNFYYSPDGKTELDISKEKILVKFVNGTSFEQQKELLSQFREIGELDKEMVLPQPKISLVSLNGIKSNTELVALLKRLKQNDKILYANIFLAHKDGTLHGIQEQLLVRLKDAKDRPMFSRTMREFELKVDRRNEFDSLLFHVSVSPSSELNALEWANRLHETGRFDFAEPDFFRVMKRMSTNDPYEGQQWALQNDGANTSTYNGVPGADMKVKAAWQSSTGFNVRVAIIDEGVDLTHPDLAANMLPGFDATGQGSGGSMQDNDAHGTYCAGVVAAVANNGIGVAGVAYSAKIVPVRVGYGCGDYWCSSNSWIANGINWAWQIGEAHILSNSYGGGSSSSSINTAIDYAVTYGRSGLGAPVFFSAGNKDHDQVAYPSSYPKTISVIAMSMCDKRKTPSSCDGETRWGSNHGTGGDVSAPGVKIYTTDIAGAAGGNSGDYNSHFNGTSSACPNAAGVMALLLSSIPSVSLADAREALESTCDKTGGYSYSYNADQPNGSWSDDLGYGRVNAANALNDLIRPASNCKVPLNFTAVMDEDDGTKVRLNWDSVFGAVNYTVSIRKVGNTQWQEFETDKNKLNINNLNSCTNYETQVRTNCQTVPSICTANVYFCTEDCD